MRAIVAQRIVSDQAEVDKAQARVGTNYAKSGVADEFVGQTKPVLTE